MITVLSGGTGTPKLLQGIKEVVDTKDLSIIVNTLENDYFSGVYVSADIDTVLYTMADMINDETWYGVKGDTFITNKRLAELSSPELLRIGDIDRATKIQKTLLMQNHSLEESVNIQAKHMGINSKIIPMSNENSEIKIVTDIGELEFHDFLIKHQSEPEVKDVVFSKVKPADGVIDAIKNSEAVIIGPSNPITSILPILSLDGVKEALKDTFVVAVSPIIGNDSVSGPASKFMKALDIEVSSVGVAKLYQEFLDVLVIDEQDENLKENLIEIINKVIITNTIMNSSDAKINLAKKILDSIV
ncbi:2-phospho-L-lactate transferase [Methanobrevibacter millerae]|uniref:2-phospho-L-lactate transferase n=1 Tax=Methanobrevibacter millerae TaxID=230361 RepID=A0A0U3E6P7_9EURY|nr:2-phospho-L-lactate transferase [Methanobrevibacter millerae]ALT69703.1 LPPG:FO 2-phospho-L-lactate transferase CofD [Methanobrevibacter millerae]